MPPGATRRGRLPPVIIRVLFREDIGAQKRLADIVGGTHWSGFEVWGREQTARARAVVTDPAR